jgi:hypothetical protein
MRCWRMHDMCSALAHAIPCDSRVPLVRDMKATLSTIRLMGPGRAYAC